MRAPLLVAFLAACGHPDGLTLEIVTDDPEVATVELLVGWRCGSECPLVVTPPDMTSIPVEHVFLVDDASPWTAPVEDGRAGFRLATEQNASVDILYALGLSRSGEIIASARTYHVTIFAGDAEYGQLKLVPTSPLVAVATGEPPLEAGTERIKLWRQPSERLPACVLAEHWDGGAAPARDLVVPSSDPDCDEIDDCADFTHLATNVPGSIDDASCFFLESSSPSGGICMIGGPICNERMPAPSNECTPLVDDYCTPLSMCTCGETWSPACVIEALENAIFEQKAPHVACTFYVDEAGVPCEDEVFLSRVDASALLGANTATTCERAGVHLLEPPFGPFATSVTTALGTLKVGSIDEPCGVDMYWKGVMSPAATEPQFALVDLALSNSKHLAVPAVIRVAQGCANEGSCTFSIGSGSDPMLSCAGAAPSMSVCQPSGICELGPECNGQCCGPGETCVDGVGCSCNGNAPCSGGDTCQTGVPGEACGTVCCGGVNLCPF